MLTEINTALAYRSYDSLFEIFLLFSAENCPEYPKGIYRIFPICYNYSKNIFFNIQKIFFYKKA